MLEMYFFLNNDEEPGQQNKAIKHTFNQHSRRQNIENEVEQQLKRVWQGIFQNEWNTWIPVQEPYWTLPRINPNKINAYCRGTAEYQKQRVDHKSIQSKKGQIIYKGKIIVLIYIIYIVYIDSRVLISNSRRPKLTLANCWEKNNYQPRI